MKKLTLLVAGIMIAGSSFAAPCDKDKTASKGHKSACNKEAKADCKNSSCCKKGTATASNNQSSKTTETAKK